MIDIVVVSFSPAHCSLRISAGSSAAAIRAAKVVDPEAPNPPLHQASLDKAVARFDALRYAAGDIATADLRLTMQLAPEVKVLADPDRLHQAVGNLLVNATRYCRAGDEVAVTVDRDGSWAVVVIADTGPGMTPETKERIFDPFFTTKGKQGTGLGLAIGKTIVEAHRGSSTCDSEPGRGTVFVVRLPYGLS